MRVELIEGDDVGARVRDPDFLAKWRHLAASDPKSTVFQEPEFALAWWRATEGREAPLLVLGWAEPRRAASGAQDAAVHPPQLLGLLALSRPHGARSVRHVGAHQAIYDGWIEAPGLNGAFAAAAVEAVFAAIPLRTWTWRYLPPGAPVRWAERRGVTLAPLSAALATFEAPYWDLTDAEALRKRLRHKRTRNYANRYRREAGLICERVHDVARVPALLDVLADWVDLRQGATHHVLPFRDDPTKRAFYLALAEGAQTRVTLLRTGEQPLAIQLDSQSKGELCLCLHGYDPAHGQRSPGVLLLVLLAERCAEEGIRRIDLTPGGDAWKRDFTTGVAEGHRVTFFATPEAAALAHAKDALGRRGAAVVRRLGATPAVIKSALSDAARALPRLPRDLADRVRREAPVSAATLTLGREAPSRQEPAVAALLAVAERLPRAAAFELLGDALKRFERSASPAIIRSEDGQVALVAWLHAPGAEVAEPPCAQSPFARHQSMHQSASQLAPKLALGSGEALPALVITYEGPDARSAAALVGALEQAVCSTMGPGAHRVRVVAGPQQPHTRAYLRRRIVR